VRLSSRIDMLSIKTMFLFNHYASYYIYNLVEHWRKVHSEQEHTEQERVEKECAERVHARRKRAMGHAQRAMVCMSIHLVYTHPY
jgi:hypothetical protein